MFAFSPQLICEQSLPHERHLWDMIGIRVRASCCAYIIERQHASNATGLVRAHLRVGTVSSTPENLCEGNERSKCNILEMN